MGELIGITGAIGSGKTTFATCLTNVEPSHALYESRQIVTEIADAFNKALTAELEFETTKQPLTLANQVLIWLPDALAEHTHHDVSLNQIALSKRESLAQPELYEKLLSYLAQVQKNPDLTKAKITAQNKETYRNLLMWIGGYMVAKVSKTIWYDEIMRRIALRDSDKNLVVITGLRYPTDAEVVRAHGGRVLAVERPNAPGTNSDITENQRHAIKPDITITNNGSLADLQTVAENIWRDIGANKVSTRYTAKQ